MIAKIAAEHDDHGDLLKLKADLAFFCPLKLFFCLYIQESLAEHFMMILSLRVGGLSPNRP